MTLVELLASLRAQHDEAVQRREAALTETKAIAASAEVEGRTGLTEEEDKRVSELLAARDAASGEVDALAKRIASVQRAVDDETRREAAEGQTERTGVKAPVSRATVTDPEVFPKGAPAERSYFRHLYRATQLGNRDSIDMLARNDKAMADSAEYRALTTVDGAGGDFVPPLWLVQDFLRLARAGRVAVDQLRQAPMPGGTDTISLPRLVTGTATGEQATQNTAVQNTDATTGSVSAAVATIAGQQVISQQLLDQSPVNMDDILLSDLAADYAIKADVFALNNNAANKVGLLNVATINAVTYTSGSPTAAGLYAKVADAIQQIHTNRFMSPDKILMHPRRWAWLLAAVDTTGRPLIVSDGAGMTNQVGNQAGLVSQGYVGTLQGLPVFVDPNIPINLGAGTNEDRIIVLRSEDSIFFESAPRSETFRETYAHQLSVLLRLYAYVAIHASRYPKSIAVISGTGLITPTF